MPRTLSRCVSFVAWKVADELGYPGAVPFRIIVDCRVPGETIERHTTLNVLPRESDSDYAALLQSLCGDSNGHGKVQRDLLWDALQTCKEPPTLKELAINAGLDPAKRYLNDAINQLVEKGLVSNVGPGFRFWPADKDLPAGFHPG